VIGQEALLEDPHFTTENGSPTNYVELNKILDDVFATKTGDEWMEIFLPHGLMFCAVQNILDVVSDPQAIANEFLVPFDHPVQGKINIPAYPIKFSGCNAETKTAAPQLGEHTDSILQAAGYSPSEIEEFRKEGVVK
jgi:crotonobetainyl-CoA:carnitine CoA-transferase CaiB-like acyl-CoA transferase